MNHNILLPEPNIKFEGHLSTTTSFPFVIHQNVPHSTTSFGLHENLELLFFLDGESQVQYDGTSHPVHKGDIVVVNSYAIHRVTSTGPLPMFCLIIDREFCRHNGVDPIHLLFQPVIRGDSQVGSLFRAVIDAYNHTGDPFRELTLKCAVLQLLLYVCHHYSTPRTQEQAVFLPALDHVRRAVAFMKSNFHRSITVDEIAASTGVSTFHLTRQFRKVTGLPPSRYLNILRCEYARKLLENGQHSVKETAVLCGFSSVSYFASVFRQYTGLLPSQVRPDKS